MVGSIDRNAKSSFNLRLPHQVIDPLQLWKALYHVIGIAGLLPVVWVPPELALYEPVQSRTSVLCVLAFLREQPDVLTDTNILFAPQGPRRPFHALGSAEDTVRSRTCSLERPEVLMPKSDETITDQDASEP
jgi:hypothetical protein